MFSVRHRWSIYRSFGCCSARNVPEESLGIWCISRLIYDSLQIWTYLIIFSYSLSRPLESLHLRYITLASTFAGENVFGSFSKDITLSRIVRTFCVGFQRSHGNSPDCGSSTGGWRIDMHKSPFWNKTFILIHFENNLKVWNTYCSGSRGLSGQWLINAACL